MRPVKLRGKLVLLALSSVIPACAAETDPDEGSSAAAVEQGGDATEPTCDETINKLSSIRNRLLDARHAAVWAFLNEGPDASEGLDAPPSSFGELAKKKIASLTDVTYARWTPSEKVRSDPNLRSQYLVVRGKSPTGDTRIVFIFEWDSGREVAHGQVRSERNAALSWTCPPEQIASAGRTVPYCSGRERMWNNWPNWSNWSNWSNMPPCS